MITCDCEHLHEATRRLKEIEVVLTELLPHSRGGTARQAVVSLREEWEEHIASAHFAETWNATYSEAQDIEDDDPYGSGARTEYVVDKLRDTGKHYEQNLRTASARSSMPCDWGRWSI